MVTEELDAVIGVDTHRDTHSAALTRPSGAVVATTVIETSGAGYRRCWTSPWTMPPDLGWSGRWRAPAATGSGLTRFLHATDRWWSRSTTPGGRLLAAGHPVVPVNPSAFHAARPRWSAAGAKSDPGDSYKLADYLRTDGHRLRRLELPDAVTCELQALVRLRDDHLAAKTASNQLGALPEAHWPGAKQLFFRLASKITLAFLSEYPTLQAAAQLDQDALAAFCHRHAYRGGRHPDELLKRLRSAPRPPIGLDPAVLTQLVSAQAQLLATLLATIADLDQAITTRLAKHPKALVLARLPRVGQISLAQLLAELGPILDHASSVEHAAAEAGATPVTRASGKTSSVDFRLAANRRARQALHIFADNSRHSSPWAATLYANARARGKRHHPQAIRVLGRAWLRVIWACWHTNTAYDPAKHRAEQRLAA